MEVEVARFYGAALLEEGLDGGLSHEREGVAGAGEEFLFIGLAVTEGAQQADDIEGAVRSGG